MSDPRHDAVLFDLDGTLYHGARPIPGAAEGVNGVRAAGTPVRFVTNNASKAASAVADHLAELGIPADTAEVSTSSQAAASVLGERLPTGATVLVVGTAALAEEVAGAGLRPVREASAEVAAVVQGHSPDTCWGDLAEACVAVRAGARWVACNVDPTLPTERGQLPGNGSMVTALRTATGRAPLVAGKPEPPLFRAAASSAGASSALVVGDRLDTDIAGAVRAGLEALVVLTGVTTPAVLLAAEPAERPQYLAADLTALTAPMGELRIGPQPGWTVDAGNSALTVSGNGAPLDLLRTLCDVAWRNGHHEIEALDRHSRAALAELGLS
ncbi:HAD-IIA family hydrolase [Amycolatopsis cihanbeyliensis]|uniref:HAD superfamily hydrolase (TIGR01450 family) n=1 Tax=Amycolatopsis cihanbeyliensis TaxID=1128664 RepID=A0A542DEF8_AMYCI|nr:HAD-IIA family hydrolase [Amycolatopsis cihanbeyliensis]TQJ01464.1 HAD superfamily hydrolase (TIGR01450 family) [Amycolatopsis cihanbeyliensis]